MGTGRLTTERSHQKHAQLGVWISKAPQIRTQLGVQVRQGSFPKVAFPAPQTWGTPSMSQGRDPRSEMQTKKTPLEQSQKASSNTRVFVHHV